MSDPAPTERTTVRRLADRASYDRAVIDAILDEALVAYVGFVIDGVPVVIPTLHARLGDMVYLHGSVANRMLRALRTGVDACLTVTLLDGLVLARSWFHHSVNYRSVVLFGRASLVEDARVKHQAMRALVDHVVPGRSDHARPPTPKELAATQVVALPLVEASAKIRTGPPIDDEADLGLDVWAGVLPLGLSPGRPVADPQLATGLSPPDHVANWPGP